MELLAPVGSKESFVTALRGGADAVYIGMPGFSARKGAAALNTYDLQVLINHAHEKGAKVFLALNTLIKHEEISAVVKGIASVEPLGPDALIVQDLGVASIVKKYFPSIPLHASTQMAVHNRAGVDFLAQQGFERAILARELSYSELKIISKRSPIPIEIFGHGALCFCVSGMCFFSSFIGGASGNRGHCTQPCRRRWENGENEGYLLSPKDLELAEHIGKLKKIGISSLKIEGRLRSSEYVYRTVKAYRLLIDAPESDYAQALNEARAILSGDMAREKTTCLFSGQGDVIFQPHRAQCLGNHIGEIAGINNGTLSIKVEKEKGEIVEGDRLRLSNPKTDTTIAFKVKEFSRTEETYILPFGKAEAFLPGNPVYKTVDVAFDQKNIREDIDSLYKDFAANHRRGKPSPSSHFHGHTALISNQWKEIKNGTTAENDGDVLWVRFDKKEWMDVLAPPGPRLRYVFNLTKGNAHQTAEIPEALVPYVTGELPPFIGERDMAFFKRHVEKMISRGFDHWVVNNVSHFDFFKNQACDLTAGHFLYSWNAYSAAFLAENGVGRVTASWEDDFLNIRRMCGPGLGKNVVVYLYGFPPVVRSRMIPRDMLSGEALKEPHHPARAGKETASFTPIYEDNFALLIPDKPVNIFTARRKFKECQIQTFGIDLSYLEPDRRAWKKLFQHYQDQTNAPESWKFNFKRGVK